MKRRVEHAIAAAALAGLIGLVGLSPAHGAGKGKGGTPPPDGGSGGDAKGTGMVHGSPPIETSATPSNAALYARLLAAGQAAASKQTVTSGTVTVSGGSEAAPAISYVKVEGTGGVDIGAFQGVLVVEVDSTWSGTTLLNWSGATQFKGVIYVKLRSLGAGGADTGAEALLNSNGGGGNVNLLGGIILDVDPAASYGGPVRALVHSNGGGGKTTPEWNFSSAGVQLAMQALEQAQRHQIVSYAVKR